MKEFCFKNGNIILDGKCHIMGILNVTPDSFSDGGNYFNAENAVYHAKKMTEAGACIIDIGAMSTRPGSTHIDTEEELARLIPVLPKIAEAGDVVLSVDTVNPTVAEYALQNGADIINDVSGIFNLEMAKVIKKYRAGWIITHTGNLPSGIVVNYKNGVVSAVNDFFDAVLEKCIDFGIDKKNICLDPGFGFAKTVEDNVMLLKKLDSVIRNDVAFLTGLSKKRFIGALTGVENAAERVVGTVAADVIAMMKGTDIIRVHDVKEAVESAAIYNSLL